MHRCFLLQCCKWTCIPTNFNIMFCRSPPTKEQLEAVLADDFKMGEEGYTRKFTKAGARLQVSWVGFGCHHWC
jgi:hypothetical protein